MKHTTGRVLLLTLIGLNLALIWGNSAVSGAGSSEISRGVLHLLYEVFPCLAELPWLHTLIRKLAHFSEFALLGLLTARYARLETDRIPGWIPGPGLFVACVDETIQRFVPGRASSLLDVWIDAAGFCTGVLILCIVTHFMKNKRVWRKS